MAERHFEVRPQLQLHVTDDQGRTRVYVFQGAPFGGALTGASALALDPFEEMKGALASMKPQLQIRVSELGGRKGLPLELVAMVEPKPAQPTEGGETTTMPPPAESCAKSG